MIDIKENKNKPEKSKKTIDDKNNKKDENEFKKKETK